MDTSNNREIVRALYQLLNQQQFENLSQYVSEDYTNLAGGKGVEGFKQSVAELAAAFSEAHWEPIEVLMDGNKVSVWQQFTGTHTGPFKNIQPTHKTVSVQGMVMYELKDEKIVSGHILTDQQGFLQQLGLWPAEPSTLVVNKEKPGYVYFIDKFVVPASAKEAFLDRTAYNRNFIRTLPGFLGDQLFVEDGIASDKISIMTMAVWKDHAHLNKAKASVQSEYKRIGFNPAAFLQELNIQMERGQFLSIHV